MWCFVVLEEDQWWLRNGWGRGWRRIKFLDEDDEEEDEQFLGLGFLIFFLKNVKFLTEVERNQTVVCFDKVGDEKC